MNNTIKYFAAATAIVLATSSCNDVLDINDTSTFGDVAVWSSQDNADAYVTAAYKSFNDQSIVANRDKFYDNYSDIMKSPYWWIGTYNRALFEQSRFGKGNADLFDCWSSVYGRIKRTNAMLNDLERYGHKWGDEWYEIRRAEGRFCNAINYFYLARVYGGVVLRTDHSGGGGWLDDGAYEQDRNRARISEEATYEYILNELKDVAKVLPEEWPAAWTGRATRGMAYAFISRIALYAKNWELAVSAADECAKYYSLVPDYAKLFDVSSGQDNSKEIIFGIRFQKNVLSHGFDTDYRPFGDRLVYGNQVLANSQPTAELVDMYEFNDGTEFDWNTYSTNHADPYTDREPRFHATVLYNGAKWEGRTIETFEGGSDSFRTFSISEDADGHTVTGYYLRKYLQEGNSTFPTEGSYNTDIIIRYAEVLLNKAEALAQLNRLSDAMEPLNEVRRRVNLPDRTFTAAMSLDDFMTILRKERCVELAGEGHRIWDLRRWRMAEGVINGKNVHGHKATRNGTSFEYTTVDADGGSKRIFLPHYYYLSLPSGELSQNSLCVDNAGW